MQVEGPKENFAQEMMISAVLYTVYILRRRVVAGQDAPEHSIHPL
jgi:hypothetical protein